MANLSNNVFDNGLNYIDTNGSHLYICDALPTTYTAATSTNALGVKATPTISVPADRTGGGREVTVSAITDGSVTATGVASHYAIVYATGTELIAAGALSGTQSVTNGNTFTLTSFAIGIPDPA